MKLKIFQQHFNFNSTIWVKNLCYGHQIFNELKQYAKNEIYIYTR